MKVRLRHYFLYLLYVLPFILHAQPKLILPTGHNSLITQAVYSSDGKKIATIGFDQTVVIWDAISGKAFTQIEGKVGQFGSYRFIENDKYFVSTNDTEIKKWNIWTGKSEFAKSSKEYDLQPAQTAGQKNYEEESFYAELAGIDFSQNRYAYFCNGNCEESNLTSKFIPFGNSKITYILKTNQNFYNDTITISQTDNNEKYTDAAFTSDYSKIITCNNANEVNIYESNTGKLLTSLKIKSEKIQRVDISKDGKFFITYSENKSTLYDFNKKVIIKEFTGPNTIKSIVFNPKYNKLVETTAFKAKLFDLDKMVYEKELASFTWENVYTSAPKLISKNGLNITWVKNKDKYTFSLENGIIEKSELDSILIRDELKPVSRYFPNNTILHTCYSNDSNFVAISTDKYFVKVFDIIKNHEILSLTFDKGVIKSVFSPDNSKLLISNGNELRIYNLNSKKLTYKVIESNFGVISDIKYLNEYTILLSYINTDKFDVYDLNKREILKSIKYNQNEDDEGDFNISKMLKAYKNQFYFDKSTQTLISIIDRKLIAESIFSNNYLELELDNTNYILGETIVNGHILVANDKNILLVDLNDFYIKLTISEMVQDEFIFIDAKGYYYGSANTCNLLSWKTEYSFYDFDQFDIFFNRPDKVLENIGSSNKEQIKLLKEAYKLRLKWLGLDTEEIMNDYKNIYMPYSSIKNREEIEGETSAEDVKIEYECEIWSGKRYIKEIYYSVDGIPYLIDTFNTFNKDARRMGLRDDKRIGFLNIKLLPGLNRIKLYCVDNMGIESLKEVLFIDYKPKVDKKSNRLHFIGISNDQYNDPNNNLQFCQKDCIDLINQFKTSKKHIKFTVDTLFGYKINTENIVKLKNNLKSLNKEDEVIVFVSGHGLVAENGSFYLATPKTDFSNPAKNSISFHELNSLLDDIQPRKKLLLIDACRSGISIKSEIHGRTATMNSYENGNRGSNPISKDKNNISITLQMMQDLFTNLNLGNGAIAFTASSGYNAALESSILKNGLFTYAILCTLRNKDADIDNDSKLTLYELDRFVKQKVKEISAGQQVPSNRQVNWQNNWELWHY
ncbi:MAG TPA: caspase family protein [Saprospiraceae bacterium]|nr:caspase family protein [Saprospiraceae bacterium]